MIHTRMCGSVPELSAVPVTRSAPSQRSSASYIDVICMHSAMLNDDTLSHRCVLTKGVLACDWPSDLSPLARQSVVPIPHNFLLLVPYTTALYRSMPRPVPTLKAKGLLPKEIPPILVLRCLLLQFPECMGSRSLWCGERAVAYT